MICRAGYRRINPSVHAKQLPNEPFEPLPESDAIEDGIQKVCQDTIVALLGVGVVVSVVARSLNQANPLKKTDDWAVFNRRAMCPLVNLVCVRPEDDK
jgi:hypothetical protein